MKKQIRVLTGLHAGARLELDPGTFSIGREPDADVQISDWVGAPMELNFRDDGIVTLDSIGKGRTARHMQNLVPRQLNEVVLCVGPLDGSWPSDLNLLSTMLDMARTESELNRADVMSRPYAKWMRWCSVGLTMALLGGLAILAAPGQGSSAAAMRRPEALQSAAQRSELSSALSQLKQPDVRVVREGNRVVVTGMVSTSNDKAKVVNVVKRFTNLVVSVRLTVAQMVADDLQSSLGEPEVSVRYLGDGTFSVAGVTHDALNVQRRVDRARGDFGSAIRQLAFDLKERATPDTNVSSMLATNSLRYIELADGTKSFTELPATTDSNIESEN